MDKNKKVPAHFAFCFQQGCAKEATCLHKLACQYVEKEKQQIICVNPLHVEGQEGEHCPCYEETVQVEMARGFLNALGTVPSAKVETVAQELIKKFNRSYYYRMRKGTMPITPSQQEVIAQVLIKAGAPTPIVFDSYETDNLWDRE